ncbi:hypothetical protein GW17_00032341 [Ensete ventricosum]|nr:hypothetical protein GW17_00032341 [Ensete ventricosum]
MYVHKPKDTDKHEHFIKHLVYILSVTTRGEGIAHERRTAQGTGEEQCTRQYCLVAGGPCIGQLADRYVPPSTGPYRLKKREKNLASVNPLLAGNFFSPLGEKKHLPAWGEGTRRHRPIRTARYRLSYYTELSSVCQYGPGPVWQSLVEAM